MKRIRSYHLAILVITLFLFPPLDALSSDRDFVWIPGNNPLLGANLMPNYTWTCGCAPTAVAMVLGYWDNYGPTGGGNWGKFTSYGRIIDFYVDEETVESYSGSDGVNYRWENYWPWDCPARPKLIVDLAEAFGTTGGDDGGTYAYMLESGTNDVLKSKGYPSNWAEAYWGDAVWGDIKNSIDAGKPCEVSIPGHAVACFGYSDWLHQFAAYNTWDELREDIDKDMLLGHVLIVSPQNADTWEEDVHLYSPDGGEKAAPGETYTIEWEQYRGTRINNVALYYSIDGGGSFTLIQSRIPSVPGLNYYHWAVPAGISTTRARVVIRGWEGNSQVLSEDGSKENFAITPPRYITISGPTQVTEGSGAQYTCTVTYNDLSTVDVTAGAIWSENSAYASISSGGYLSTTAVSADQSCTVTASYGGKSDTHSVTIKQATPNSITISGPTQVNEGNGAQYTCTATYSNGSTRDVTAGARWSEYSLYASISSGGYLITSAVSADQSCTITASYGGRSDTHSVTIKNVVTISGYVRTSGGTGITGVTVTFSNSGGTATTDSSGYYSRAVSYGWSGSATPSLSGYTFIPTSLSYTNVTTNQSNQNYTEIPQSGSLTVTLGPSGAVSAGAQWNVDGGAWQNSGATVSSLSVGSHTVNYKAVTGWIAPSSETVMITGGQTASLNRNYAQRIPAELVLNFGPAYGLYHYGQAGGWEQWNTANPSQMVPVDLNSDGMDELVAAFPGFGLYIYDSANGWQLINTAVPEFIAACGNRVACDFGATFGLWYWSLANGWEQLSTADPDKMIAADIDGDGQDELIVSFIGFGLYYYEDPAVPTQINTAIPDGMLSYSNGVVCDFGAAYGLWSYSNSGGWVQFNTADPDLMVAVDIDNDGQDELAVSFAGYGLYTYAPVGGIWQQISTVIPDGMIPQGNGIAVDYGAAYGLWVWSQGGGWQQRNTADPGQMTTVDIDGDGVEDLVVSFSGFGLYYFDETIGWQLLNDVVPDDMQPINFYP